MGFKPKKGETYGDFTVTSRVKVLIRGEPRYEYQCECKHCGEKQMFRPFRLSLNPTCDCQTTEVDLAKLTRELVGDDGQPLVDENGDPIDGSYSLFQKQVADISSLLTESGDKLSAQTQFQLNALKMLVDVLPTAEKEYRQNPKASNSQSLTMLINQIRELMADVMAEANKAELVDNLIVKYLTPLFTKDIAQEILDGFMSVRNKVADALEKDPEQAKTLDAAIVSDMTLMIRTIQVRMNNCIGTIRSSVE